MERITYGQLITGANRVLALGFFDGVHRGHMKIAHVANSKAREYNYFPYALTLSTSPKALLGGYDQLLLCSLEEREHLLAMPLLVLDFNKSLLTLTPREFVEEILVPLGTRVVVCGQDYRFGHQGAGTPQDIITYSNNTIEVVIVNAVMDGGEKISSRLIHQLIDQGEIERANKWLGRPYLIRGRVVSGNGVGRRLGYPTINCVIPDWIRPPLEGVYAVEVDGVAAVANFGFHKTVNLIDQRRLEIHFIDNPPIPRSVVICQFHAFLRPELKFANVEELKKAIALDIEAARKIFTIVEDEEDEEEE